MTSIYQRMHTKIRRNLKRRFLRYSEILKFLDVLAVLYPQNVRVEKIGRSIEKRPIMMIVLQDNQLQPKNAVMIEGGIHAREWLSHATALYVIDYVLTSKSMLEYMDFYIIPCINPDGYECTHTWCRLWRKNMNKNNSGDVEEWGVDLNRNFPVAFGCKGSSGRSSSGIYRGVKYLSEPESQSLAKTIKKYSRHIKLYLSLHSYGHLIMYPWGCTTEACRDYDTLHKCAAKAVNAMKSKFPESKFKAGQLSKILYIASGTTTDFVRKACNIKFCFTMELHREGTSGFTSKASRVVAVSKEVLAAIRSMVKFVHNYYCVKRKKRPASLFDEPPAKRFKYCHH